MCSILRGPLCITSPVDFSRIDSPFCLPAVSDGFPSLVCVELTGESSSLLTLWQITSMRDNTTRDETALRKIIKMTVLLLPVILIHIRFKKWRKTPGHDGSKSTISSSTGVKVRGKGKGRRICVDNTKCRWNGELKGLIDTHQSWFSYSLRPSLAVTGRLKSCRVVMNLCEMEYCLAGRSIEESSWDRRSRLAS